MKYVFMEYEWVLGGGKEIAEGKNQFF